MEQYPWIIGRIDTAYEERRESPKGDPPYPLRISSALMCPRKQTYRRLGYKGERIDGRTMRIFSVGDIVHDDVRQAIVAAGIEGDIPEEKIDEFSVSIVWDGEAGKMRVDGHPDGIVHVPEDGVGGECVKAVLEIKTINPNGWRFVLRDGPKREAIAQASCYAEALGLDWCLFIYYNKGDGSLASFLLPKNKGFVKKAKAGWEEAYEATADSLPERPYHPSPERKSGINTGRMVLPWQCAYCDFWKECWGDKVEAAPAGMRHVLVYKGDANGQAREN